MRSLQDLGYMRRIEEEKLQPRDEVEPACYQAHRINERRQRCLLKQRTELLDLLLWELQDLLHDELQRLRISLDGDPHVLAPQCLRLRILDAVHSLVGTHRYEVKQRL